MINKPQYINYCIDVIDNAFIHKFKVDDSDFPSEEEYLLGADLIDEDNE